MPVKGGYLFIAGTGAVLLWSGLKGKSWSAVIRDLISGNPPSSSTASNLIGGPVSADTAAGVNLQDGGGSVTLPGGPAKAGDVSAAAIASYKAFAAALVIKHGWPGQMGDLTWIVEHESNWNPNATNSSSGAYGIAQALGHGTANTRGTKSNMYGNYGTSDAICKSANSGNGYSQLIWMCNYLKAAYGSPSVARARYNQGY
jgi:Transglycosylase SLT domain